MIVEFIDSVAGNRDEGELRRVLSRSVANLLSWVGGSPHRPTSNTADAGRPRQVRDAELRLLVAQAHAEDYGVYGAKEGLADPEPARPETAPPIVRCTVERPDDQACCQYGRGMADFAMVYTMDGKHAEVGTFDSVESAVTLWDHWVSIRPEDGERGCESSKSDP